MHHLAAYRKYTYNPHSMIVNTSSARLYYVCAFETYNSLFDVRKSVFYGKVQSVIFLKFDVTRPRYFHIRHFSLLNVNAAGACGYDFPCDGGRLVRAYLRLRRGTI